MIFLVEIFLIIFISFCIYKVCIKKLSKVVLFSFLLLVPIDLQNFGGSIGNLQSYPDKVLENQQNKLFGGKTKGKVYHLILDGFSPYILREEIKNNNYKNELEGFVFYTNAKANYGRTHLSIPSMIYGGVYDNDSALSFLDWSKYALLNGYPKKLSDAEIPQTYFTFIVGLYKTICKNFNLFCHHTQDTYRSKENTQVSDPFLPADLAIYSYLPSSLRYLLWQKRDTKGRPDEIIEMPIKISNFF